MPRERGGGPPIVTKADVLAEIAAIVRRTLGRPDFRLGESQGRVTNRQLFGILEALKRLEERACRSDAS
jgi:hypothetical protein